ncbi:MAG TPA: hypothetical protein DDW52_02050 [Planctomycetaceae bacterium]|nr:hypothetical protein [Planctomycetaceae bacterium]
MEQLTENSSSRVQIAIIGALLLVAVGLLGVWLYLRPVDTNVDRISVLDAPIDGFDYQPDASAAELLKLADVTLDDLSSRFPDVPQTFNVIANRDFLVSDTGAAKSNWTKAVELEPSNTEALFGLANVAFEDTRYEDAIGICETIDRLAPNNPKVPLLLADALLHAGKADEAALVLEQHLATEQGSVQAIELLGNAHLQTKSYEKAAQCFQRAIDFAPKSKDAHYGLAQAFARLGDRDNAKRFMERFKNIAKEIGDEHAEEAKAFEDRNYAAHVAAQVYVDSANIFRAQGDIATACNYILRAHRLQPDVEPWLTELQRMFFSNGQLDEAADVGEHLVGLAPQDLERRLNLASLYADLGRADDAIENYEAAIELAPDDPRCQQAKQIINQLNAS